jgi:hypothetical protein
MMHPMTISLTTVLPWLCLPVIPVPLTQFRLVLSLSTLFMGTIMPRPRSKACIDIREADEVLKNLFFAGEKPPPYVVSRVWEETHSGA